MARIVHIALKVDDLEKASQFYEKLFGFKDMETAKVRDHTSRHLSDGTIDLALIKYDKEESAESQCYGVLRGPQISSSEQSGHQTSQQGCARLYRIRLDMRDAQMPPTHLGKVVTTQCQI